MYTMKGKFDQEALVREYLPIVRRQALALQVKLPSNVDLNDLIQAGVVGLLDAMGRFDVSVGASFMTFASQRIRGAMIDELRTRDWLPRSARRNARAMEQCIHRLEQRLGRPPTEREIADGLDMDMDEYHKLLNDTNNGFLLALEELESEEGELPSEDDDARSIVDRMFDGQRRALLARAIESLPEREKQLLALYYQEELNLKEIGAVMGITGSRVCQLHNQAVTRLRAKLREYTD